jgi:hypothetical protein
MSFPIFKVNKLTNKNKTEVIYVFYGSHFSKYDDTDKANKAISKLNNLFEKTPNNKTFDGIFNNDELKNIKNNNIPVKFVNETIHFDDNIGVIKLKIFEAISKEASMSEIYLYCLKSEKLNPITVYQNLTQNDRLPLTKVRLNQLLLNLYDDNGQLMEFNLPDKMQYTFDDILNLKLNDTTYLVGKAIGQKFVFSNEYPFISDPFLVEEYDALLEKSRKELSTLNTNLLLDSGDIFNNTIYLCLAKDVFEIAETNEISTEYTSKIYYPFLYKNDVDTLESLDETRNKLISETSEKLSEDTKQNFKNINMFYNIFQQQKQSSLFSKILQQTGIKSLKIIIYPEFKVKIPIDIIFKLIHATQDFPLIKYNPETRQENIYRLFAPELSLDGRKIPYLEKATIYKLMRTIGKTRSVAVYNNIQYNENNIYMCCEFQENGNITIYPLDDFKNPILLNPEDKFGEIDNLIQLTVNPLIEQIKPFFEQSGLEIPLFVSIQSSNVEIRDMKYQTVYKIKKKIYIDNYIGCISSVFTIESHNEQKIKMRYKRVSNFNKRDSIDAFIIEKIDQGLDLEEINKELLNNNLIQDINEGNEIIAKIFSELEVIRGANRRRALMIQINPGFQTIMNINPISSELTINVSGINNVYYLETIPVYIDTIVRITQDIQSTEIKKSLINSYCKGTEIADPVFEKITAQSEQKIQDNVVPIIRDEESSYIVDESKQLQNAEDLLDILGYYDESSAEFDGGNGSSSEVSDNQLSESSEVSDNQLSESSEVSKVSKVSEVSKVSKVSNNQISKLGEIQKNKEKELELEGSESESEVSESESEPTESKKESKKESKQEIKMVAEDLENTVQSINEMPLMYPNPFSTRLEQRMPQLFVTSKDSKMQSYSRMCPFNLEVKRQPIILTKEEKDEMLKENPGELDEEADFIEYGADSKDSSKKFYYTCPKYWCLLTNKMVTEKDILDGKCSPKGSPKVNKIEDAIIPKGEKIVPKGKYVFQFYDDEEPRYPGFHKNETPSGLCIPCCYKKWDTETMITRRNICQGKNDENNINIDHVSEKEREINDQLRRKVAEEEYNEKYVKGPDRYGPKLGEHRWGFLPIVIQHFLREVNEDCLISKTNPALKQNHMCILRHGVQVSSTQSFIACIASAMFYPERDVPSIKEMKNILIDSIDLDKFIKLQNGDLITSFSNPDINVKIDDYKDTRLYNKMVNSIKENTKTNIRKTKTVIPSSIAAKEFIIKVAQSFENFKNFLRDDKTTIDHTYLWDLVSIPNPKLFPKGINLIILEIPENDASNNVELLCPTNHYSDNVYDSKKQSLFLIKREKYFEPIYGYTDINGTVYVTTTFDKKHKSMAYVFEKIIKPTLGEKCKYFMSKPNEYKFKQAPLLDDLIRELIKKDFTITMQILNFQGKVIGVLAKNKKGLEGFIPCYPSALTMLKNKKDCNNNKSTECDYDYAYMNDDIWKSYGETLEFLKHYYKYKKPKNINEDVNCYDSNYFCRVAEDGIITGFLTNTNQFVPINVPIPITDVDVNDSIKTISSNNTLVADINTLTNNNVDSKRADFIKRIQLETNFYNVFRNTIRILFNDYANNNKRKQIKKECNKRNSLYNSQLDNVIKLLRDLTNDTIIFASEYKYTEINDKEIQTCVSKTDKCEKKGSVCRFTNDKCQLVLPKINLINGTDNEQYYYGKMADELIRYNRIKSFIFKPQSYLSFGQIKYNLRDDEIIILQDLLNNEFFENLEPSDINKFAKFNTYDTAKPILTQMYDNEKVFDNTVNQETECVKSEPKTISSIYWKSCFPDNFTEIKYSGSNNCSLHLIIDIVEEFAGKKLTISDVKRDLIKEYSILTDNFTNKERLNTIINILKEENQIDAKHLQDEINLEDMIKKNDFIALNFDLWLLLSKYEISSIFISSKVIPETRFNEHEFVCYSKSNEDNYVFIITPAMSKRKQEKTPTYRVIKNNKNSIKIRLPKLINDNNCLNKISAAIQNYITVEEYLDKVFKKDVKTIYKPRQQGLRDYKVVHKKIEPIILEYDDTDDELQIPNDTVGLFEYKGTEENAKKACPPEKELNPNTNRCVNKCNPGFTRDEKFKCKKQTQKVKKCPPEKEINPNTNRCVNICKPGLIRDENFKCKKQTKKNRSPIILE